MFKKEIKPLAEGMADSITKSINKLQHVEEKASRPADHAEGDVKPADISGEEEVKADGSAKKAPVRKGDKAVAEAYMDEKSCVGEMKKLHASSCSKTEMYKKVSEKYGCSEEKFEELYAQYCGEAYEEVQEDNSNDKSDDGEGMDKVQPKAVKKKFDDRKDKDIDNDGDEDSSDEYLHKRRKAISKALESKKLNASVDESAELEGLDEGFSPKDIKMAIGIASDKRYAGGNMTGAVRAINKLKRGLSDHPQVSAVLKRQNEDLEEGAQILAHGGKGQYKAVTKNGSVSITFKGKTIATGDFDRGADAFFLSWKDMQKGKKNSRPEGTAFDTAQDMVDFFAKKKITESYGSMNASVDKVKIQKQIDQAEKHMKTFFGNTSSVKMKKFAMQKKIDKLKAQLKEEAILDKALNEAPRPPKINKGKAKGSISATGMRGKGNKKYDVMVGFDNGKFSFRITDEGGRFQTVGIKQASKMLGEENVNSLGLQELTSAEKKLINQMYDKKGNLTPIGKKVMDQGKAASKLSPKDIIKDKARRKEYTAFQKSKRNEELDEAKKSDYTIYHKTFSSAVQHAIDVSKKRGFEVDEDDWDRKVAMGPRKPGRGKTNSYTIDLMKSGKSVKNKLQMQVYYDEGRYELNMYIS
jgi:hypothetical protein